MIDLDLFASFYMPPSSYVTPFFEDEDAFFFSQFWVPCEKQNKTKQVFIFVWIYVRVFISIPLIHISVHMPVPKCIYYYSSQVELEFRDDDISRSSFIIQDFFWLSWVFVLSYASSVRSFLLSLLLLSLLNDHFSRNNLQNRLRRLHQMDGSC